LTNFQILKTDKELLMVGNKNSEDNNESNADKWNRQWNRELNYSFAKAH